ncbi:uncharacterized protein [Maniola hyperantus]|uniref:uncharacterized protein isoform X3 n=1 Tax=Aphantopus hyperantus TaxID=2795564 RepID=UPI003748D969
MPKISRLRRCQLLKIEYMKIAKKRKRQRERAQSTACPASEPGGSAAAITNISNGAKRLFTYHCIKQRKRHNYASLKKATEARQRKLLLKNPTEQKPEPEPGVNPGVKPKVKPGVKRKKDPSASHSVEVTFPKSSVTASRWARAVSRHNDAPFPLKMGVFVCSHHFPPWLIGADEQGAPRLDKDAVPTAEPFQQEEKHRTQNIEEVLLPSAELKQDLAMKVEAEDPDDESVELKHAVNSIVDIPPPENGLKLQCINLDNNENATLHYLSVDKDYTVNHTRVDIHKNNIATLHYVDTNNKVNHTLRCIDLNGDNINSYEELINPNITDTQQVRNLEIEIASNMQNDLEQSNFRIDSRVGDPISNNEENDRPDQYTEVNIQNTSTDDLDTHAIVKCEDVVIKTEIDDTISETDDSTSKIQPGDDDDHGNEEFVVKMEYDSDDDS